MSQLRYRLKGFSLVEIMIALAVIGIMSGVGATLVTKNIERGRVTTAQGDTRSIMMAVEMFHSNTKRYPGIYKARAGTIGALASGITGVSTVFGFASQGLRDFLITDPTTAPIANANYKNWKGPYLDEDRLDPWGNSYLVFLKAFTCESGTPNTYGWVISSGSDGILQTGVGDSKIATTSLDSLDLGKRMYASKC
ncbi:type II secretion system protein GspG [Deltaproteobacteria bacterium TL4]